MLAFFFFSVVDHQLYNSVTLTITIISVQLQVIKMIQSICVYRQNGKGSRVMVEMGYVGIGWVVGYGLRVERMREKVLETISRIF